MSFRWTLARETDADGLTGPVARGEPPPAFLSRHEAELLAGLAFAPRRRKWLLGRLAAKRVLAEAFRELCGVEPLPIDVTVANDPAGVPFATVAGERVPWCLSISHRAGVALAILAREPGVALGGDLETVAPRDPGLARDFFTPTEQERVAAAPPGAERDRLVARIWSAKESVLKALGVGLRVDTRAIEIAGEGGLPWPGVPEGFRPLDVRHGPSGARFLAVTRDEGPLVLTVARVAG